MMWSIYCQLNSIGELIIIAVHYLVRYWITIAVSSHRLSLIIVEAENYRMTFARD